MQEIWNNINGGWADTLQDVYGRIGKARANSPALQSQGNYMLSKLNDGGG